MMWWLPKVRWLICLLRIGLDCFCRSTKFDNALSKIDLFIKQCDWFRSDTTLNIIRYYLDIVALTGYIQCFLGITMTS